MIHPKEKAEELVNKFHKFTYTAVHAHKTNGEYADAKECAFIAIDEIINILKEKESKTDIKISNFIIDNFNNKLLFLIPQHPTSIVFIHLANQILKKLNMNLIDINEYTDINEVGLPDSTYNLKSNRFPLHISAISHYNMNYIPDENANSFYEARINDYFYYNPGMQIPNYKHYDDR